MYLKRTREDVATAIQFIDTNLNASWRFRWNKRLERGWKKWSFKASAPFFGFCRERPYKTGNKTLAAVVANGWLHAAIARLKEGKMRSATTLFGAVCSRLTLSSSWRDILGTWKFKDGVSVDEEMRSIGLEEIRAICQAHSRSQWTVIASRSRLYQFIAMSDEKTQREMRQGGLGFLKDENYEIAGGGNKR